MHIQQIAITFRSRLGKHDHEERPAPIVLSVVAAALASCGGDPTHPFDSDAGPGVPNVGSVVHSTPEIFAGASMAWVEPGERIAFHSLDLEAPGFEPLAARWDESGIRVLAAEATGAVEGFHFPSGTGPATRSPLFSGDARVVGGVMAAEGDGFAIWSERCIGESPVFGGCSTRRTTVYTGRFGAGEPTALGSSDMGSTGFGFPLSATSALLFSPDGDRLYYALDGVLYVADVP